MMPQSHRCEPHATSIVIQPLKAPATYPLQASGFDLGVCNFLICSVRCWSRPAEKWTHHGNRGENHSKTRLDPTEDVRLRDGRVDVGEIHTRQDRYAEGANNTSAIVGQLDT
jgi:hypothetical protein